MRAQQPRSETISSKGHGIAAATPPCMQPHSELTLQPVVVLVGAYCTHCYGAIADTFEYSLDNKVSRCL